MIKTLIHEKNIAEMVRRQVTGALREILSDPDAGLILSKKTERRLQKSVHSKEQGDFKPLIKVLEKY